MIELADATDDRGGSGGRLVLGLVVVLVVLFGGAYAAMATFAGERVPRGTTVEGVAIGGLTAVDAEDRLRRELAPQVSEPIELTGSGRRYSVDPAQAGLRVDYAATVAEAGAGRSWRPARLWAYLTEGDRLDTVLVSDPARLKAVVAGLATEVDQPAREGGVLFTNGRARSRLPVPGVLLDQEATAVLLRSRFLDTGTAPLPLIEDRPEVDAAAVRAAVREVANPAVSGAVALVLGTQQVVLTPRTFAPALSMRPVGDRLVLRVDGAKLMALVVPRAQRTSVAPRDAGFRLVGGRPVVVPARIGLAFDRAELVRALPTVLARPPGRRSVSLQGVRTQPALTTADARRLRIRQQVSTFTTFFPYAAYRNVNLARAAALVDGTVLAPKGTFSLNGLVGERTRANGFTEGYVIRDGLFRQDLGGGVSQIATTLFNAMFFAGLEDVQHKPHSVYIDRYPVGREATVAWPTIDLRFANNTPYGVLVEASVTPSTPTTQGRATVTMYSTPYWRVSTSTGPRYAPTQPTTRRLDAPDCEPTTATSGFSIDVTRTLRRVTGGAPRTQTFHTDYIPGDRVVCG